MKKTIIAAVAGLVVTGYAYAGELGGEVGITSDYTFRGISMSDEDPSVFGNVNYTLGNLTVTGTASQVAKHLSDNNTEFTVSADYYIPVTSALIAQVGVIYYNYDNVLDVNTVEYNAGVTLNTGKLATQVKTSYSEQYFGYNKDNWYTEVNAAYALPYDISLTGHYGYTSVTESNDYKVGALKTFGKNVVGEVAWVKTEDASAGRFGDDRWVATAKYRF